MDKIALDLVACLCNVHTVGSQGVAYTVGQLCTVPMVYSTVHPWPSLTEFVNGRFLPNRSPLSSLVMDPSRPGLVIRLKLTNNHVILYHTNIFSQYKSKMCNCFYILSLIKVNCTHKLIYGLNKLNLKQ